MKALNTLILIYIHLQIQYVTVELIHWVLYVTVELIHQVLYDCRAHPPGVIWSHIVYMSRWGLTQHFYVLVISSICPISLRSFSSLYGSVTHWTERGMPQLPDIAYNAPYTLGVKAFYTNDHGNCGKDLRTVEAVLLHIHCVLTECLWELTW